MNNILRCEETLVYRYQLEPGDMTSYRFGYSDPGNSNQPGIISPGMGLFPGKYIWFYIDMSAGCGCGVCMKENIIRILEMPFTVNYITSHGFEHVDAYTLRAVLLALSELVQSPYNIEQAAKNMLRVQEFYRKGGD